MIQYTVLYFFPVSINSVVSPCFYSLGERCTSDNEITILNNRRFCIYSYSLCDRGSFENKCRKGLHDRRPACNGSKHFYKRCICVSCECFLHGCRNNSECCGYDQSMEVVTTSKETMLFYDSCFILFWSGCSRHHSSCPNIINYSVAYGNSSWSNWRHTGMHKCLLGRIFNA